MKNKLYSVFLAVFLLAACAPQVATADLQGNQVDEQEAQVEAIQPEATQPEITQPSGVSVVDALDRQVTFEEYPAKIVVAGKLRPMIVDFLYLFESSAEKIIAIEAGGQASENFIALIDDNIENKYSLEKGATAEQIAPLEPDLVILKSSMKESVGDQLEKINIPVVYVDFETIDQIYRDIRTLGQVLGESERAEEIVLKYQDLYTEFKGYVTDSTAGKQTVLMQISDSENQYAYEVPSVSYLQTGMVEDAGGDVIWKEAAQAGGWNEINLEQLNVWDPDQIFVINYQGNAKDIITDLKASQPFGSLKAVANDQLKAFPFDYISWDQPDTRWILGYSWLVYQLNPDAVSREQMLAEISDFYQFFYSLDEQQIEQNIIPKVADYY